MKGLIRILFFIVFTASFLSSCKKDEDIPPVPEIGYKDFVTYGSDSAVFSFTFKDGDGDIGLSQTDTFGSFSPKSKYYNNLFMKYYYKNALGAFVPFDTSFFNPVFDTAFFTYRLPDITPKGQRKVLDGEIRVTLLAPLGFVDNNNVMHTVIKYEAYIYDRALNRSNIITTEEIPLN